MLIWVWIRRLMGMIFYNVDVLDYLGKIKSKEHYKCEMCGSMGNEVSYHASFGYFNIAERYIKTYRYLICPNCLETKIKNKTMKELKHIIPLFKMKSGNVKMLESSVNVVFEKGVFSEEWDRERKIRNYIIYDIYLGKPKEYYV